MVVSPLDQARVRQRCLAATFRSDGMKSAPGDARTRAIQRADDIELIDAEIDRLRRIMDEEGVPYDIRRDEALMVVAGEPVPVLHTMIVGPAKEIKFG